MRIWLDKTVDEEFADLGTAGHTGTLNDRQYAYLAIRGYTGALADKMAAFGGQDVTAPVLSGNSFNDTDDEATFTTTEGGTFVWATHLTTETLTANGSGGWTGTLLESGTDTVASFGESTISAAYTATTGTGGENRKFSYYIRDAAGNDSNVITEAFTVNSSYVENFVDNNDTGYFSLSSPYVPHASQTEWVFTFKPQSVSGTQYLYNVGGRSEIKLLNNALTVIIKDTTNTTLLNYSTGSGEFSVGVEYQLYVGYNSAAGTYEIKKNGAAVSGSASVGPLTGATIHNAAGTGFLAQNGGNFTVDAHVSEMFMGTGSNVGAAAFWNGGIKGDLATLAGYTPDIYMGGGDAATVWNAGTNRGSATTLVVSSATFTEA